MLDSIRVSPAITEQFPDYAPSFMTVTGIVGGPSNDHSEALLRDAEERTKELLARTPLEELEEVKTWREAYQWMGVKPRVARSSFEALMRRVDKGLPRIDLLTDIYNAVSVSHRIPIGGENLDAYVGAARLVLAEGHESFDTMENGEPVNQSPDAGEVVWMDDAGVTCRRWNWRQCVRTRLHTECTSALFIIDGLGADSRSRANAAMDDLQTQIEMLWLTAEFARSS